MGYLVCDKCGGYYELQTGESPDDFSDECECGGKTRYVENFRDIGKGMAGMGATIFCSQCGTENPADAKLCKSCKKVLTKVPPTSATKSKKSGEGIAETWNKQANAIKALSIIGICCVGIILIVGVMAMFSPDKNTATTGTTTPTTSTQSTNSASSSSSNNANAQIQVSYSGSWSGAVGDSSGSRSVDGSGTQTFPVSATGAVSANFQKKDNSTGTLTVSIIQSGKTLETQSTTATYGVASVSHYF
jgi:hypothetical protein